MVRFKIPQLPRFGWAIFVVVILPLAVAGCPDFSHQAPIPDYDNMTDEGSEPNESVESDRD